MAWIWAARSPENKLDVSLCLYKDIHKLTVKASHLLVEATILND